MAAYSGTDHDTGNEMNTGVVDCEAGAGRLGPETLEVQKLAETTTEIPLLS